MKTQLWLFRLGIVLAIILIAALASWNTTLQTQSMPTPFPTPTPEKLKLVNGELDPCQLFTLQEVENVLGIEVFRKKLSYTDGPACLYFSKIGDHVLFDVYLNTDATLQRQSSAASFDSAAELYAAMKNARLRLSQKMPQVYTLKEIDGFGEQAFLTEDSFLTLHVLNNGVYCEFVTHINDGIGYELLFALAQIAQQRMP